MAHDAAGTVRDELAFAVAALDECFDYLVNNAGFAYHNTIDKTTEAELDNLYNVHFKGVFFLTQKLLPLMNDGGRIVNTSTGLTRVAFAGSGAYASMKGAVEVLTRYLAKELGARGSAVNTVAPGPIATDFSGGMVRDNPDVAKLISSLTSLGRPGVPDEGGALLRARSAASMHFSQNGTPSIAASPRTLATATPSRSGGNVEYWAGAGDGEAAAGGGGEGGGDRTAGRDRGNGGRDGGATAEVVVGGGRRRAFEETGRSLARCLPRLQDQALMAAVAFGGESNPRGPQRPG
jgi:NAD(P)-dependent dehydrogenase (short-subunit alcohol dehydrogenase family)